MPNLCLIKTKKNKINKTYFFQYNFKQFYSINKQQQKYKILLQSI